MINMLKSGMLMILMTALFLWIGRMIGGEAGMVIAFGLAMTMNLFSYWYSDRLVLATYQAKPVTEQEAPELVQTVRELSAAANIPMPKVYVIPQAAPNAFATGRNPEHAAVAVTQGILRVLDKQELRAVLAHEIGHVVHRDILIGTIVATFAGAIMLLATLARWGAVFGGFRSDDDNGGLIGLLVASIVAPLAALLIQMGISRSREYLADEKGARLCRDPLALARALRKLESVSRSVPIRAANPQTAHMFTVNPLKGRSLASLFSTHPSTDNRVDRLEKLAREGF